ncbi:MAG: GDSL-type esterase/lipase family protein [Paludibacter sp.]
MSILRKVSVILCCLFVIQLSQLNAQIHENSIPKKYLKEFTRFIDEEKKGIDTTNLVVFIGSSTFTMWNNLQSHFPTSNVLNRGFGGSKLTDVINYADQILYPYKPKQVVLYEGDNDLGSGIKPDDLLSDLKVFVRMTEIKLPGVPVVLLSVKYSPKRHKNKDKITEFNAKMKDYASTKPQLKYVDIAPITLNADGTYKRKLYMADTLHVNQACYNLYAQKIEPFLLKK